MHFRLAPRAVTLVDLELLTNEGRPMSVTKL